MRGLTQLVEIIEIPGLGRSAAEKVSEDLGIKSQNDTAKLDEAKEITYKKGFYEGVNLSLAYCEDCGHQQLEMEVCPKCGSANLTKIDRMNGYLSYSRVHGDTRLNAAKMAEIKERVSM